MVPLMFQVRLEKYAIKDWAVLAKFKIGWETNWILSSNQIVRKEKLKWEVYVDKRNGVNQLRWDCKHPKVRRWLSVISLGDRSCRYVSLVNQRWCRSRGLIICGIGWNRISLGHRWRFRGQDIIVVFWKTDLQVRRREIVARDQCSSAVQQRQWLSSQWDHRRHSVVLQHISNCCRCRMRRGTRMIGSGNSQNTSRSNWVQWVDGGQRDAKIMRLSFRVRLPSFIEKGKKYLLSVEKHS